MRIGVLIGKTDKGGFDYIGNPGDVDALDKAQRAIVNAGGKVGEGKTAKHYVKTWLADASQHPLKAKKC